MLEKFKKILTVTVPALMIGFMLTPVSNASEGSIGESMKTAFEVVKTDFLGVLLIVAPIAIAIIAAPMVWKLGIRFFKMLTSG